VLVGDSSAPYSSHFDIKNEDIGAVNSNKCSFYLVVEGSLSIPQLTQSCAIQLCCTYDLNSQANNTLCWDIDDEDSIK